MCWLFEKFHIRLRFVREEGVLRENREKRCFGVEIVTSGGIPWPSAGPHFGWLAGVSSVISHFSGTKPGLRSEGVDSIFLCTWFSFHNMAFSPDKSSATLFAPWTKEANLSLEIQIEITPFLL